MDTEQIIVGFIILAMGGFYVVRPGLLIRFQVWTQKVIMGARYEPSTRTYKTVRILGAIFVILGLLILTGILK